MNHDNPTFGFSSQGHSIAHYYGDTVRWLFVGVAAILMVALPAYPDVLPLLPIWQIVIAIVLVVFAALTNPRKRSVLMGDALIAGLMVVGIEFVAIASYAQDEPLMFALREGMVVALLFSLYFSLKTVRAMALHQIGKKGTPHEFDVA